MKKFTLLVACILVVFSCNNDTDNLTPAEDPQVVAEFRPNLSELNLFTGSLEDLNISSRVFEYQLNTPLFTDYAHKQRLIALPNGTSMTYIDDGFPIFPENTVIAKTFYYNNDERDLTLGKTILETRVLIKKNGEWQTGDYKWNAEQTDAVLHLNGSTIPVTWIDANGQTNTTDYKIPSDSDCFTCHSTYNNTTPIGPKLRNLNFEINNENQIQSFINQNYLIGLTNTEEVNCLPNWEDTNYTLEDRARAYLDINCAHCHIAGGFCEYESTLNLAYETPLEDTNIIQRKNSIINRISVFNEGFSMPYIGTTLIHNEGIDLILTYLDTL